MDTNLIIKGIALVIAVGLLLSNIDFSYLIGKFLVKDSPNTVVNVDTAVDKENSAEFLKTLELWYLLKRRCDESKLVSASQKLDEVFPLLNDNLEEK
jgi:hypothetical protein